MNLNRLVMLTGFEPFGEFKVNPSWEAVKLLDGKQIAGFKVKSFQISLAYMEIRQAITRLMDNLKPDIIISLGQSYRSLISLEKVALNFADLTESNVLYNCETRPKDEVLEPKGPTSYFTTLPIREILNALRRNQIPSEISYTAGTFGCNQIFYHIMHRAYQEELAIKAGFMHVPSLPSQAAQLQKTKKRKIPSMDLNTIVNAIKIAVEETIIKL